MLRNRKQEENRTVYSTETGRVCPNCGKPIDACVCKEKRQAPHGDGIVRVRLETKGRKGKSVTTISGVMENEEGLKLLLSELKRRCGAGGAVKDGVIEIQGDHCDAVIQYLREKKLTVKRAGG
jgi:translation initiation factor 1